MVHPSSASVRISDPVFRHAVELIDAGDVDSLRQWIDAHPDVLRQTADEDGSYAGDYFANPRLIWFVAENPIRNGRLPDNICQVIDVIVEGSRQHHVPDLIQNLNVTLALVGSGMIARQCGLQCPMIETLIRAGGDPNSIMVAALAHRECDAASTALKLGARLTLSVASALDRTDEIDQLAQRASPEEIQEAFALAAINGRSSCVETLLKHGADVNAYNPEGMHAHSTALHQAVYADSLETVDVLLKHGADKRIKDRIFGCDAEQWAEHEHRDSILKRLQ